MPIRLVLTPTVGAVRGSGSGRLLFLTVRRLSQVASLTRAIVVLASHSRIERMRVALAGTGSRLGPRIGAVESAVFERSQTASVFREMGRRIDVEDLLTATEVADLLGFSMRQVVSTYARRYNSFPRPTVVKSNGHTQLWAREDVEEWDRQRGRQAGEEGAV